MVFSKEIVFAEPTSVESSVQTENPNQTSNENPLNNSEIKLRNGRIVKQTPKPVKSKIPAKSSFAAVLDSAKETSAAIKVKPENEASKIKNADRNSSEKNLSPISSPKTTISAKEKNTLLPEKEKKDFKPGGSQSPNEKPSRVRQVFENIRQGFKNGKNPINIFDP
jgi:hypothetical protein